MPVAQALSHALTDGIDVAVSEPAHDGAGEHHGDPTLEAASVDDQLRLQRLLLEAHHQWDDRETLRRPGVGDHMQVLLSDLAVGDSQGVDVGLSIAEGIEGGAVEQGEEAEVPVSPQTRLRLTAQDSDLGLSC